jgi:hypothetical protein
LKFTLITRKQRSRMRNICTCNTKPRWYLRLFLAGNVLHSSENCDFGPHDLLFPPDGTCVALDLPSLPFVFHLTFTSRFRNWVQSRREAWNCCKVWGLSFVPEVSFGGDRPVPCLCSVVYEWITYFVHLFPRHYAVLLY